MEARTLATENSVYESRKEQFEKEHNQEWVVIHESEVVGFFPNLQEAADAAIERYGKGPYLIRQVGVPDLPLPLSMFTKPIYA